jgi:hypothetical protein
MKHRLSAIALGVTLVFAGTAALAGPTASTTQTGTGNSAYIEQNTVDPLTIAEIVQTGNNNIAGDPLAQTPGILQINTITLDGLPVRITQTGDSNQAAITQSNGAFHYTTAITQLGNLNSASLLEDQYFNSETEIRQTGNSNVANLLHHDTGGGGGWIFQEGDRNVAHIHNDGLNDASSRAVQTGSDNSIDIMHTNSNHAFVRIEQTGTFNSAIATRDGGGFGVAIAKQNGTGNLATISQTMLADFTEGAIGQDGIGNVATLTQMHGYSHADILQTGDLNTATIVQHGSMLAAPSNTAYITQVGNGFVAAIAQTGNDNHAGIYQH